MLGPVKTATTGHSFLIQMSNSDEGCGFAFSRRDAPEFCVTFRPRKQSNCIGSSPVIGLPQGWRWRAPACGG